jgi:hypothetical protein
MSLIMNHMPDRAGVLRAAEKVAAILPPTLLLRLEVDAGGRSGG